MADLRALVTLPYLSGKPEDISVNVLHFNSASTGEAAADVIRDHVAQLFNVTPPLGFSGNALAPIASFLSNALSRVANACTVKVYDLATPLPRIPIVRTWTLGPATSTTAKELPAEVALCASIFAGQNVKRRRGRIYFGPFTESALEDDSQFQRSRPAVILRDSVFSAVRRMMNLPANTQNLAVHSKADNQTRVVTGGWVDDAWDIQRRRGQDAALRNTF